MIDLILWALFLFFIYIAAASLTRLSATSTHTGGDIITIALGSRDTIATSSQLSQRAARAQRNMEEGLLFFLPLAILLILTGKADGIGLTGATVFVIARALYLPSYVFSVFALRSLIWTVGVAGILMMVYRLLG